MPFIPGLQVVWNVDKVAATGWGGVMKQFHSGLGGSLTRFTAVTKYTGADHIFPDVFASPVAGNNMVQGKLLRFLTAVLAGVLVTVENLEAS